MGKKDFQTPMSLSSIIPLCSPRGTSACSAWTGDPDVSPHSQGKREATFMKPAADDYI